MIGRKRKASDSIESSSDSIEHKKIRNAIEDNAAMCLTGLNDYCIMDVLRHLQMEDLVNVAQSSQKLKTNADIVFRTAHDATIDFMYDPYNFLNQQKVLQHFGRLAKKCKLSQESDTFDKTLNANKVLRSIVHFCGPNLQEFMVKDVEIDLDSKMYSSKDLKDVKAVLGNLTNLMFVGVCTINYGFFQWTRSLKELTVHSCCDLSELCVLDAALPQLKKFDIDCCFECKADCLGDKFNDFLKNHPTIEQLNYHLFKLGDHLEGICSLPLLGHLEVDIFDYVDLTPIFNVKRLKKLVCHVGPEYVGQFSEFRISLPIDCQFSVEKIDKIEYQ